MQDLPLEGQKVLMRVDYNVPLNPEGAITDDTRIRASIPSIQHILDHGGSVILMSHLGRPQGSAHSTLSLAPCVPLLSSLLHRPVLFAPNCIGPLTQNMAESLKPGQVLLLENLRFVPAEENPSSDPLFAKQLASLADLYVNDAFGTAHRAHSSTAAIAQFFPGKAALGLLMQKEVDALSSLLFHPKRPFYAIIGGAKVSTKMGVLHALLEKVDALFIGGAMIFTFLKAQGIAIGNSLYEEAQLNNARALLHTCATRHIPLHFPADLVIADAFQENAHSSILPWETPIPTGWHGMDIGPATISTWSNLLSRAATLFWNGPLGVFEWPPFAKGTYAMAQLLAHLPATTVVGGGDSVAAIERLHLTSSFSHVSTGGGAALEFIEFGHLPGIDALSDVVG